MAPKHGLPEFLEHVMDADTYRRWLHRKATAHVVRDRKRQRPCGVSAYKQRIHEAVVASGGRDFYTGESLDWHLISQYRNEDSKLGRHEYKSGFAMLPTVDHLEADIHDSGFEICAWRTNDAKNDLSQDDFIDLCRKVLSHAGYVLAQPAEQGRPK